jgi:hypothetical protein
MSASAIATPRLEVTVPYSFYTRLDYGLLRALPDSLGVDAWGTDPWHERGEWRPLDDRDLLARATEISEDEAKELVGEGDLNAPNDEERYARRSEENAKLGRDEPPPPGSLEARLSQSPGFHPMAPEDRLGDGQSMIVLIGPKPAGDSAHAGQAIDPDGAAPRRPARETG